MHDDKYREDQKIEMWRMQGWLLLITGVIGLAYFVYLGVMSLTTPTH